jgi:hypothetical protein
MKTYPTIPHLLATDRPLYLFAKLDGSNIRAEWSGGGWRLGSRRKVLSEGLLAEEVPGLFEQTFAEPLAAIFRAKGWSKATAYFEFHGPGSFAGQHIDEPHTLTLLDVAVHRRGILLPGDFLATFGHLPCAALLHHGPLTPAIRARIEDGTLPGMPPEGIVAKGDWYVSPGRPLMFKHKSRAWLARLREKCTSEEEFERLR